MPLITDLVPQQRRARVNLHVDGAFAFALSDDLVALHGLRAGMTLSDEQLARLQEDDVRQAISEAAWRLLATRARSRHELRDRLLRRRFPVEAVDAALVRLQGLGHLDDAGFARAWVESRRGGSSARGPRALRHELRAKGVDGESVDAALAGIDELAAARAAAERRARALGAVDYRTFTSRLGGFLLRRGFASQVAREVVAALWQERGGAEEGEAVSFGEDVI